MKKKVRAWEAIFVVFATLLTMVGGSYGMAIGFSASINNALGVGGAAVTRSEDGEYNYYPSEYTEYADIEAAYLALCEEVEGEGIVLLKNENNALPLAAGEKISCFLTGSVNFNYSASGSSAADSSAYATLKDALETEGFSVNGDLWSWYLECGYGRTKKGNNYLVNEAPFEEIPENIVAGITEYGTAIVSIARDSGEGKDINAKKSDTIDGSYLTLSEQELGVLTELTAMKQAGSISKIVVLLNSSATIQLDFLNNEDVEVDACLWVGNVGKAGISAVAAVLSGKVNPSGRLSDTYLNNNLSGPASAFLVLNKNSFAQYYTNWEEEALNETQMYYGIYSEGIYVGYRYYETRYTDYAAGAAGAGEYSYTGDVAYPFGYGESYTDFSYSDYSVSPAEDGKSYNVSVTVTNTGDSAGKETVLVWLSKPYTDYDRETGVEKAAVELVGFDKTALLQPGESEKVSVNVERSLFRSYDSEGYKTYIIEAGDYLLTVARDAHGAANNFLAARGFDTASTSGRMDADGNAEMVYTETVAELDMTYSVSEYTGNEITNQLEFADINKYEGLENYSVTYVSRNDWEGTRPTELIEITIDNDTMRHDLSSNKEITGDAVEMPLYGQNNGLKLADMRGLDFDNEYWEQLLDQMSWEDQALLLSNGGFSSVAVESVSKPDTFEDDGPVGVIASSGNLSAPCEGIWASTYNTELIEAVGDMMAEDARAAGKTGLYAGGVNIHRTPFGGRSAEYFSEDPYLTAVASQYEITGMQNKGVIAFVKHYAFNDEESQRNGICIWLNEQEAREIMLLPFEYSVAPDKGNSHGLMTSFNRAGAVWTGASSELLRNILIDEFGFEGYNITDMADSNGAIYMTYQDGITNGTDMFLGSGSAGAFNDFKDNAVFAQRMRESAHRILYTVANYSCAMNGLSGESLITTTTPWWQTALVAVIAVLGVLTAGSLAMYAVAWKKSKK